MAYGEDMKKMACALLVLCLIACGKNDEAKTSEPSAKPSNILKEAEFAFNAEQFADAFNAAAKSYGQPFRLNKVDVKHGAVHDYFRQEFSNRISLTVGVSKETGHVTSITALIAEKGGATDNGKEVLAISEIVIAATNPNLGKEKTSGLVADMLKEAGDKKEAGRFPQRFINHVRYVLRSSGGIGYWWIANPA
jgi:hypothetical protein